MPPIFSKRKQLDTTKCFIKHRNSTKSQKTLTRVIKLVKRTIFKTKTDLRIPAQVCSTPQMIHSSTQESISSWLVNEAWLRVRLSSIKTGLLPDMKFLKDAWTSPITKSTSSLMVPFARSKYQLNGCSQFQIFKKKFTHTTLASPVLWSVVELRSPPSSQKQQAI